MPYYNDKGIHDPGAGYEDVKKRKQGSPGRAVSTIIVAAAALLLGGWAGVGFAPTPAPPDPIQATALQVASVAAEYPECEFGMYIAPLNKPVTETDLTTIRNELITAGFRAIYVGNVEVGGKYFYYSQAVSCGEGV